MSLSAANLMSDANEGIGRIGRIPVRNLWLLMLYASDLFRDLEKAKVAVEDNPDDIPDLVAEMLCRQVERRIQRNLSYGYQSRVAVLGRVRGRIDLLNTERHRLLDRGKVACRFDELIVDTARNRLVRAALEEISKIVRRDALAHRCRSLAASLRRIGVIGERPGRGEVSIDRFGRHDVDDQSMVAAAHLEQFSFRCIEAIAGGADIVSTLGRREGREGRPHRRPQGGHRARRNGPQAGFEFGKDVFNRIEVGAVGGQVEQVRPSGLDRGAHASHFMAGQIVHHDPVARVEGGDEHLFDIGHKAGAIDWAVQDRRGGEAIRS